MPEGNFCWLWKPRKGQWLNKTHHLPCTRRKHSSSVDGRGRHKGMVWNNWLHYSKRLATDETYGNATAIFIVDWIPRILMTTIGDKMSWDTSPKTGLFYVLLTSKGGNIAFLPHPLRATLCPCSSYLQKTTNTPTLNGGDRGGVRILLFSKVTLVNYNVSTILSPIAGLAFRKSGWEP